MVGRSLGHYEILEPLGSGGMGDVYRAHDTTLDRDVAIKVLPEGLADDPDRLARLKREAHLLAALNHPNVATIHGFEESNGTRYLVMELVKGESLEQRLAGGALPVDEALGLCRQIAEALEVAHEEGIIHRDLKPANVLITPDGRAKVLDFGLAKTVERATSNTDLSHSPTITIAGTEAGVILGTAPYMSPEQVRGKPLDKRADIWAFGCVLYETLTGSRAFNRETVADTLAAILEVEPPWDALPRDTPAGVRALLRRCLRKDTSRRLRDIGDARIEIEEEGEPGVEPGPARAGTGHPSPAGMWTGWTRAAALVLAAAAIGTGVLVGRNSMPSHAPVARLSFDLQPGTRLSGGFDRAGSDVETQIGGGRPSRTALAFTPDGGAVVYAATDGDLSQLYLRYVDDPQPIPIAGTEGGSSPFLSPDGREVGFVVEAAIKVVPLGGGLPRTVLSDAPLRFGGRLAYGVSWTDDWIVFAGRGGIFRVPDSGGAPEQITGSSADEPSTHAHPQLLPGAEIVLYTVQRATWDWDTAQIVALPIGGKTVVVIPDGADARYVEPGYLVFARRGTLMAVGFDPERLETTGEPRPIDEVMQAVRHVLEDGLDTGAAQFAVSSSGSLAYASGGIHPEPEWPPVWVDRAGMDSPFPPISGKYLFSFARLSPDGTQVAYRIVESYSLAHRLAVTDLESGATRDLPLEGIQRTVAWSPDGTRLAFSSRHEGDFDNLYWIDADLSGDPVRITDTDSVQRLSEWSVDDVLAFTQDSDVWVVDLEGKNERMFVGGPSSQSSPAFSPDGRWIAYATGGEGQRGIYVRPYPAGEPAYRVSSGRNLDPAWARDGSELFYRTGENWTKMMAVRIIDGGEVFRFEEPRELFDRRAYIGGNPRSYDVAPDGRFLMTEHWEHPPQPVTQINIVLNWFEELRELLPAGR